MFIIFIYVTSDDPAAVARSVEWEFKDPLDKLVLKANFGRKLGTALFNVKNIVWGWRGFAGAAKRISNESRPPNFHQNHTGIFGWISVILC